MVYRDSLFLVAAMFVLASPVVIAAPCFSTDPTVIGTSSTDDVTLNGLDSDACEIVASQNSGQGGGEFGATDSAFAPASSWTELYHNEKGGGGTSDSFGPISGVTFSNYQFLSTGLSGSFGFDWSGGPAFIDFVFSMHAGGNSGYFLFDEFQVTPSSGTGSGTWVIEWVNNGDQNPDYSNVQLWARAGDTYVSPQVGPVPEPATLALLGLGLAGIAASRRRKLQ